MGRYIDADKVVDVMKVAYWDENMHSAKDDQCVIDAMIDWSIRQVKDAPTEAVAPVVHAHWITRPNPNYSPFDGSVEYDKICSNCFGYHECFDNYCPDCGAKMDEVVQ